MASKAIDLYTVELELLENPVNSVYPVRCVATNTDDQSTPEISLSLDGTRAVVAHAYGGEPGPIEECMQQLQDHNYVQLVAQYRVAKADFCIFTSKELVTLGFVLMTLGTELDARLYGLGNCGRYCRSLGGIVAQT